MSSQYRAPTGKTALDEDKTSAGNIKNFNKMYHFGR